MTVDVPRQDLGGRMSRSSEVSCGGQAQPQVCTEEGWTPCPLPGLQTLGEVSRTSDAPE